MKLSLRLQAIADMAEPGSTVVDVGCDHGYIPIWLTENSIIKGAAACDVNREPLLRAKNNIALHDLEDKIETILSDGLSNDEISEFLRRKGSDNNTLIIAGMGGQLIIRILDKDKAKLSGFSRLIIQPQSKDSDVRAYLSGNGFAIIDEKMVFEDGKYYKIIKAVPGKQSLTERELIFGPVNISEKSEVFISYLEFRRSLLSRIRSGISGDNGNADELKIKEIESELKYISEVLSEYEGN